MAFWLVPTPLTQFISHVYIALAEHFLISLMTPLIGEVLDF